MATYAPFAKPLYVMLKPVSSICNLRCKYCYYLEKNNIYKTPDSKPSQFTLSESLLEEFIEQYINSQTQPQVLFTWHGGETMMRPISFYKRALEIQKKYAHGRQIDNSIQTNGTLITEEWAKFFADNNWLVGVSIDGPQEFHDEYRRSASGGPSWNKVMKGLKILDKYNVQWNAMAVVNDFNGDYPMDFYHFFKDLGAKYIQFAPIVERLLAHDDGRHLASLAEFEKGEIADFSVSPKQWGDFMIALFDEWVRHDVGEYYIQFFDSTLANWVGEQPGVCSMGKTCGHAGVMEFNGDVYTCDHFVFPEYKLGNIRTKTLSEMMYSPKQLKFGQDKYDKLPKQCKECKYLFACNGGCPKDRFSRTKDGEPGLNYLCEGWYRFFDHVAPYMDFMKNELQNKRPPANVMQWIKDNNL